MSKQIFHHYELWEDYKHGFYDSCSGEIKQKYIKSVVKMFSNPKMTKKYMNLVAKEWKFSMEHNLTNPSINHIAYIGQCACCKFAGAPNTITMNAWNYLDIDIQTRSDKIAEEIIIKWTKKHLLKNILKSGKKDVMHQGYQIKLLLN